MSAKHRRGGGSWFAYIQSDSWWWTSAPMRIAMGYRTSMKGWDTCLTLWYLLVNVLTPRLVIINWTICKQSARGYCCAKVIVIEVRWHWVNIFCLCCTTRRAHHVTSQTNFRTWILKKVIIQTSTTSKEERKTTHRNNNITAMIPNLHRWLPTTYKLHWKTC